MTDEQKSHALRALVNIQSSEDEHGMGFICQIGPYLCIITASHCLPRLVNPRILRGEPLLVSVTSLEQLSLGTELLMRFLDPCADIAILSDSNWQCDLEELSNGQELQKSFWTMFSSCSNLEVCTERPDTGNNFQIHLFNSDSEWITGIATARDRFSPLFSFSSEGNVRPGTSGAPIFNDSSQVIGIVSAGPAEDDDDYKTGVLLSAALPHWAFSELCQIEN